MTVHPAVRAAAEGTLPEWAVADAERRAHMARVSDLLGAWAEACGLPETDQARWRAAGHLHDALRGADPDVLRPRVPVALRALPGPLLHGPAAAERLRVDGVEDGELLRAIAFHTVGDAGFGALGRALYAADFLEPGRTFLVEWRAGLRERMPGDLDDVARDIVGARIRNLIERETPVLPGTIAFWNAFAVEHA